MVLALVQETVTGRFHFSVLAVRDMTMRPTGVSSVSPKAALTSSPPRGRPLAEKLLSSKALSSVFRAVNEKPPETPVSMRAMRIGVSR